MTIIGGKNCEGCHQKDWCIFLSIFSEQVASDDICPCETCLVKMICNNPTCEDHDTLWETIWHRWIERH